LKFNFKKRNFKKRCLYMKDKVEVKKLLPNLRQQNF